MVQEENGEAERIFPQKLEKRTRTLWRAGYVSARMIGVRRRCPATARLANIVGTRGNVESAGGSGDSNPDANSRNPFSEKTLGNGLVGKSVNSQCLDGSVCQLMADADSDMLHIVGLWGQLPNHLRNTIMMLIDACETTGNPNNK